MRTPDWEQRLSRISTQWTLLIKAHERENTAAAERGQLLEHYAGAIYRYLLGALGDPDAAEDLAQEFALRFLRGDFHRARPERGRFRNYLKTALVNLVNDHHRQRQAAPVALPADTPDRDEAAPDSEVDFAAAWRAELLEQTWKRLADVNPTFHATLLLRVQNPDMPSPEMAAALALQLNKPMNAALVRKTIQRAQEKFADLLLEEVQATLDSQLPEEVQAELQELDLVRYCRSAVRKSTGPPVP